MRFSKGSTVATATAIEAPSAIEAASVISTFTTSMAAFGSGLSVARKKVQHRTKKPQNEINGEIGVRIHLLTQKFCGDSTFFTIKNLSEPGHA